MTIATFTKYDKGNIITTCVVWPTFRLKRVAWRWWLKIGTNPTSAMRVERIWPPVSRIVSVQSDTCARIQSVPPVMR